MKKGMVTGMSDNSVFKILTAPPLCEKRDCVYFSTFTETCDFLLINCRRRPCGVENCTEYQKREEKRLWMRWTGAAERRRKSLRDLEEDYADPDVFTADCCHEVAKGEPVFVLPDTTTCCADCAEEWFNLKSLEEKAAAFGVTTYSN